MLPSQLYTLGGILGLAWRTSAALSRTGSLTYFSDTGCTDPVFVNNAIIGEDFCAKADNSNKPSSSHIFQSYILNERPWCVNGSRPYLNVYRDIDCHDLIKSYPPGPLYNPPGPDADPTCVTPGGDFKALAFICDGFEGAWGSGSQQLPPSTTTPVESVYPLTTPSLEQPHSSITTTSGPAQATVTEGSVSVAPSSTSQTSRSSRTSTQPNLLTAISTSSTEPTPVSTAGASWATPALAVMLGGLIPAAVIGL